MTVTDVQRDTTALTMTVSAHFTAGIDRVWQLWADPRQLERWWGPPTYPATVLHHDLTEGGSVRYQMTGPEGDVHGGWWRVIAVEAPVSLEVEDGFADEAGNPNSDMPTMVMRITLSEDGPDATSVTIVTTFGSREQMDQLVEMGMEEGMHAAMGQMDALLT